MSGAAGPPLRRVLALGPLIGITFFTVSGGAYGIEDLVPSVGPGMSLLLLLAVPLVWSLPIALVAAELATAMPDEGGYYVWVRRSLGEFWGFQEGWWNLLTSFADSAIYPVLFVGYLHTFAPGIPPAARFLIAAGLIWGAAGLNMAGIRPVGASAVMLAILVQVPVVALVAAGFGGATRTPWRPFLPPGGEAVATLGVGISVLLWNYSGWDNTSTFAGEVRDPERTYPLALLGTLPLVALGYVLPLAAALAAGVEPGAWKTGGLPAIGAAVGGPWLGYALALGGMGSMAGLFSALLLSYSRLPFVLARDGYLPAPLARLHPVRGTPCAAIAASAAACTALVPFPFKQLVVFDVLLYCLALGLQCAALVRRRLGAAPAGAFRIPGGPLGVALAVACPMAGAVAAIGAAGAPALAWSAAAALTGPVAYGMIKKFRARAVVAPG
ncbi:MAG TPA: APC family permease [Candidatus Methylomirabilis sp.]